MSYEDHLAEGWERYNSYDPEEIDVDVQDIHRSWDWNGSVEVRFIDSEDYEIDWQPDGSTQVLVYSSVDEFSDAISARLAGRKVG